MLTFKTRIARQVLLGKARHKLALELHVIDNGPGVPPQIKDRIFYPLVTGRAGGSGLGLSLAQNFVQQHAGRIECHSEPGRTDFKILIPLTPAKQRDPNREPPPRAPTASSPAHTMKVRP